MKSFNTTAVCTPETSYMVDISDRINVLRKFVDDKKYFTINRARQYGKTTTLVALEKTLEDAYNVIALDFQDVTDAVFTDENTFSRGLAQVICDARDSVGIPLRDDIYGMLREMSEEKGTLVLNDLFRIFDLWCRENERPVVLIIDEVDSATNNQVFLDFLGKLRSGYLKRQRNPGYKTFQSVILAGVTDVKHLRLKIREDEQHKVNSPWNIAADFDMDMSLSEDGIRGMLDEYEADHHTGMDTGAVASIIREYTNGYPYLVSRICQIIDTRMVPGKFESPGKAWTEAGVCEAVKMMLSESGNSLFDSVTGKLTNYPQLKEKLRKILMRGETLAWLPYDEAQQQLFMYGLIRNNNGTVAISNRIFEMLLYTQFIGERDDYNDIKQDASENRNIFVDKDGWLDIPMIMEHFIREHNRIHGENSEKFLEEEGRERFLTFISGIINGTGTYDIEPQTRDHRRMDVVIHYLGRRYVIELKIWRCERYNSKGEEQIICYLDYWGLSVGYMLSFCFNRNKEQGVKRLEIGDRVLFEGIV